MAEIKDKPSDSIPSVADMRESQRKGNEGKGTNDPDTKLNEAQNHSVDIKD
jgi:hypothetical protein